VKKRDNFVPRPWNQGSTLFGWANKIEDSLWVRSNKSWVCELVQN